MNRCFNYASGPRTVVPNQEGLIRVYAMDSDTYAIRSRYTTVFQPCRHGLRSLDTLEQMGNVARRMQGKRLMYKDLIA